MAPLPLLKLGGLVIKTLAKPVASRLKDEARKHPTLSKTCIRMGQMSHQFMSRLNVLGKGYKILGVEPLPEPDALSRGIDILAEIFIFTVGGSIMMFEFTRSEIKSAQKAAAAAKAESDYREYLEGKFRDAQDRIAVLEARLEVLEGPKPKPKPQAQPQAPAQVQPAEASPERPVDYRSNPLSAIGEYVSSLLLWSR